MKKEKQKKDVCAENANAEQPNEFTNALVESSFESSFFYTNDKLINRLDNNEIFLAIQSKYDKINDKNEDSAIKKQFVEMLNDVDFIESILSFFNITIYDLFKVLYNKFGSLFKGQYLKKVKSAIDGKRYLSATRKKHEY